VLRQSTAGDMTFLISLLNITPGERAIRTESQEGRRESSLLCVVPYVFRTTTRATICCDIPCSDRDDGQTAVSTLAFERTTPRLKKSKVGGAPSLAV
jgi:hypothetical protein